MSKTPSSPDFAEDSQRKTATESAGERQDEGSGSTGPDLPSYDPSRLDPSRHSLQYLASPAPVSAQSEDQPTTAVPRPNRYFEGISSNATKLGISVADLLGVDAQSPFTTESSQGATDQAAIPQSLSPSSIQRRIPHHPFLDCIPIPSFRDRSILACATEPPLVNRFDLCYDMFAGGLTFSDNPEVEDNWQYSDEFRRKWTALLQMDIDALLKHVERTRPDLASGTS